MSRCCVVKDRSRLTSIQPRLPESPAQRMFYLVFLPCGVVANMALGLLIISGGSWANLKWLQVGTGGLCCAIAGWLAAAAWSKAYWNRSMAHQVAVWRRIADAFFTWLEDAPLPADALHGLQRSLDEVVPNSKPR